MSESVLRTEGVLLSPPDASALEKALALAPEAIVDAAEATGLTDKDGRPAAPLLRRLAAAEGSPLIVLPLGTEEELFLEALMAHCAEWLAAGALLACAAVSGAELIIYAGDEVDAAPLREQLSKNTPAGGLSFLTGPATVVLREESALYAAMVGKPVRSELMEKQFLLEGFEGRPTLILDAETFCWLAASCLAPGTARGKLIAGQENTVKGGALQTQGPPLFGLFPMGAPLADVAEALALSTDHPLLLGGPCGRITPASDSTIEYSHDFDTLRAYDAGCCMADVGRALTERTATLSCGKCVLCREGSWQLRAIFGDITAGRGKRSDFDLVADIGPLIALGAFCDFGRNMVRPAMGLAEHCRADLEAHIIRKTCPAGVCAGFASYAIDPKLCTGCGECLDACEYDAIKGKDGYIHMIDEDYCEKCGKCVDACEEGAAKLAAGRMKLPKRLTKVGAFK